MTNGTSTWDAVLLAGIVILPGLVALIFLLVFRSWLWRARYREKPRRGEAKDAVRSR